MTANWFVWWITGANNGSNVTKTKPFSQMTELTYKYRSFNCLMTSERTKRWSHFCSLNDAKCRALRSTCPDKLLSTDRTYSYFTLTSQRNRRFCGKVNAFLFSYSIEPNRKKFCCLLSLERQVMLSTRLKNNWNFLKFNYVQKTCLSTSKQPLVANVHSSCDDKESDVCIWEIPVRFAHAKAEKRVSIQIGTFTHQRKIGVERK